jgi:hypothetical protein
MRNKLKFCHVCEETPDKTAIALTKKLIDEKATRFYCLSCLAAYLDVTEEELLEKAEDFKSQGCTLFS